MLIFEQSFVAFFSIITNSGCWGGT